MSATMIQSFSLSIRNNIVIELRCPIVTSESVESSE